MAAQRGETSILVHKIPAMVCLSREFHVFDESVKARIEEVVNDCEKPATEVVIWRYAEKENREDDKSTRERQQPILQTSNLKTTVGDGPPGRDSSAPNDAYFGPGHVTRRREK